MPPTCQRPAFEPTAAAIKAACEEIQKDWTPREFARRRGTRYGDRHITPAEATRYRLAGITEGVE